MFDFCLYLSLIVCIFGIIFRIRKWFIFTQEQKSSVFNPPLKEPPGKRILNLLKILVFDVLFQLHILKKSTVRWLMHFSIFAGFIALVFMHALDEPITQTFFPDYASTLNPFFFLRNLFGAFVLAGILIAIYRRIRIKELRKTTNGSDLFAIFIILAIIVSGFLLESVQILSPSIFYEMKDDYGGIDDEEEINALKAYWAADFGVEFSKADAVIDNSPEILAEGKILHEDNCASCHSRPVAAFVSFPLANLIRPLTGFFEKADADTYLWYFHFLACFAGLAFLPFSKFFHMVATPVNIIAHEREKNDSTDRNLADKNLIDKHDLTTENESIGHTLEFDACTHCGVCSIHCSVAPIFSIIDNIDILPSEKLDSSKTLLPEQKSKYSILGRLAEGSYICTECSRCTTVCPSKIDLHNIWKNSKKKLRQTGYPDLHEMMLSHTAHEWAAGFKNTAVKRKFPGLKDLTGRTDLTGRIGLTDQPETFRSCVQCTTCTSVCPVVAASDDPEHDLDLTPQQIMNLMRLQLKDLALGARMVWSCTTCYMCQEHCPQGVRVADVLYELRNIAVSRLGKVDRAAMNKAETDKADIKNNNDRDGEKSRESIS